jgi:hypothetical protein
MPTPSGTDARSAKLKNSFLSLSKASRELNDASDTFGVAVSSLEDAINELNPGVSAWVTISRATSNEDRPWESSEERLGYDKVNGRWGLALCTVEIDNSGEHSETVASSWLFKDGPRNLRLRAIDHVPELVEALSREVSQAAKRVSEQADYALTLAESIAAIAGGKGNAQ